MVGCSYTCDEVLAFCNSELKFELGGNKELVDTCDTKYARERELLVDDLLVASEGVAEDEGYPFFAEHGATIKGSLECKPMVEREGLTPMDTEIFDTGPILIAVEVVGAVMERGE